MRSRNNSVIGVWVGILVAIILVSPVAAQEDGPHLPPRSVSGQPIPAGAGRLARPDPSEQELDSQGNRPLDPAILEEINQIRTQLGGGVAAILKDLDLKPGPQPRIVDGGEDAVANPDSPSLRGELRSHFDQEIYRLMRDQGQTPSRSLQANPVQIGVPVSSHSRGVRSRSVTSGAGRTFVLSSRQAGVLRESARHLEEVAAGLEGEGLYSQADQVRDQARVFWVQARPSSEARDSVRQD